MKISIVSIDATRERSFEAVISEYVQRLKSFAPVEVFRFRSEETLFFHAEKIKARTSAMPVLLDERGRMFSSAEFAAWLGRQRDSGLQNLIFAVGPADGWSDAARQRAGMLLSLGPMTLPHELALVVLAEQVYRGFTILAGHPYHRA